MAAGQVIRDPVIITKGKPTLADECERVLKSIGDDSVTLQSLSEETGIPTSKLSDMMSGPLSSRVSAASHRVMGVRVTLYHRKEA